ncbi:hypothetical protein ILUMI_12335 [Ignelater luminosus]|uniref:HTH psq-type domain-containing protein n=1 Tax=Ignelater luminosus TaxID=2038154 RepID=A0A8K0G9N0_IGNLU|nr:hypothetical protein ILUMI_12335 [Ignelater luminosus]
MIKKYDEKKQQRALQEIKSGNSKKAVSVKYGIPRSTLQFRLGPKFTKMKFGHHPYLTKDEEQVLIDWILESHRTGFRACGLQPWNPNSIDFSKCLGKEFNKINESVSNNTQDKFSKSQNIIGYEEFFKIVGNRKIEAGNMLECSNTKFKGTPSKTDKNLEPLNVLNHELTLSLPSQDTNMEKEEKPHKSVSVDDTGPFTSTENLGHVYNEQKDGLKELERKKDHKTSHIEAKGKLSKEQKMDPLKTLKSSGINNDLQEQTSSHVLVKAPDKYHIRRLFSSDDSPKKPAEVPQNNISVQTGKLPDLKQ